MGFKDIPHFDKALQQDRPQNWTKFPSGFVLRQFSLERTGLLMGEGQKVIRTVWGKGSEGH